MSTDEAREKFIRSYLTEEELTRIVAEARKAADVAVPTYSQFYVGACILTHEGEYIFGANIENISYTQTIHAEGCAIAKAVSAGKKNFKAVAVYAKSENFDAFVPPCGECRQFLSEFSNFLPIIMVHETGSLMFEVLHEILPLSMVLGSTAPKGDKPTNKYDLLVSAANQWILKDIHSQTRNEMRQLLREWKFDEIHELTKEKLQFKESGTIVGKFRAGSASINYLSVQTLVQSLVESHGDFKGKIHVQVTGDKTAESLAHRIVATLASYGVEVSLNSAQKAGNGASYLIKVTGKEDNTYEIAILKETGENISKDVVEKIYQQREKYLTSRGLNEFYDYKTNRLLHEDKYKTV